MEWTRNHREDKRPLEVTIRKRSYQTPCGLDWIAEVWQGKLCISHVFAFTECELCDIVSAAWPGCFVTGSTGGDPLPDCYYS